MWPAYQRLPLPIAAIILRLCEVHQKYVSLRLRASSGSHCARGSLVYEYVVVRKEVSLINLTTYTYVKCVRMWCVCSKQ